MLNGEHQTYIKEDNSKILYESAGCNKWRIIGIVLIIILLIRLSWIMLGVCFEGNTIVKSYEEAKIMERFSVITIFTVLFSFIFIIYLIRLLISARRCWIKVFDNHIEAQTMSFSWNIHRTNSIYMLIGDIDLVEMSGGKFFNRIKIIGNGKKYRLLCKDTAFAYSIINQLVLDRKRARQ